MLRLQQPTADVQGGSDFLSEDQIIVSGPSAAQAPRTPDTSSLFSEEENFPVETAAAAAPVAHDFVSEPDAASLFPVEPMVRKRERPIATRPPRVPLGRTPSWSEQERSKRGYLWSLVIAIAAVLAVEGVARLKDSGPSVVEDAALTAPEPAESSVETPEDPVPAPTAPANIPRNETGLHRTAHVIDAPSRASRTLPTQRNTSAPATPTRERQPQRLPAVPIAAAPAGELDTAAIQRVLETYRQAHSTRNAAMVASIWHSIDSAALQHAFDDLDRQSMSFERCDVTLNDATATASCRGILDYARKPSPANTVQERLALEFDLQRVDGRWLISNVEAR